MASGYVVAALLETAGLIGLVIAVLKIRSERQLKAADLRSFLRSGDIASSAAVGGSHRVSRSGRCSDAVPFVPGRCRVGDSRPSTARSALGRAIARGEGSARATVAASISAG